MGQRDDGDEDNSLDIEAVRRTQDEARAVLDHQIETFRNVDDKAARTFRLDAILLGLVLTAVSFATRADNVQIEPFVNWESITGIALIIISFIFAVITYTTTNIQTGIGSSDIRRFVDGNYTEEEWLSLLLRSEAAWMEWNEKMQTENGTYLTISHASLILGVVGIAAGIAGPALF